MEGRNRPDEGERTDHAHDLPALPTLTPCELRSPATPPTLEGRLDEAREVVERHPHARDLVVAPLIALLERRPTAQGRIMATLRRITGEAFGAPERWHGWWAKGGR